MKSLQKYSDLLGLNMNEFIELINDSLDANVTETSFDKFEDKFDGHLVLSLLETLPVEYCEYDDRDNRLIYFEKCVTLPNGNNICYPYAESANKYYTPFEQGWEFDCRKIKLSVNHNPNDIDTLGGNKTISVGDLLEFEIAFDTKKKKYFINKFSVFLDLDTIPEFEHILDAKNKTKILLEDVYQELRIFLGKED